MQDYVRVEKLIQIDEANTSDRNLNKLIETAHNSNM